MDRRRWRLPTPWTARSTGPLPVESSVSMHMSRPTQHGFGPVIVGRRGWRHLSVIRIRLVGRRRHFYAASLRVIIRHLVVRALSSLVFDWGGIIPKYQAIVASPKVWEGATTRELASQNLRYAENHTHHHRQGCAWLLQSCDWCQAYGLWKFEGYSGIVGACHLEVENNWTSWFLCPTHHRDEDATSHWFYHNG